MSDKAWKAFERRVAEYFGSERTPLSGGNSKVTRSDTFHPTLFIEAKQAVRHAVWTLHDKTKALARLESKTPLLVLSRKGSPGFMICIHSDNFDLICNIRRKRRKARW